MHSFADWRRLLGLQPIGPFAPVWLTRNGLVKRLLQAGLVPLQEMWELLTTRLANTDRQAVSAALAAFAPSILCLDETRLDALGRYLKPLRGLSTQDPACFAGKLVGLFNLRAEAVATAGMARGGPRDLSRGYAGLFAGTGGRKFAAFRVSAISAVRFFDTLTQRKLWWVSRYRENTSYRIAHEFYRHRGVLDALV